MRLERVPRAERHIQYRTKDGTLVPGVTSVLSVLNKPALLKWANNLGLNGIVLGTYVDGLAQIGRCAHVLVIAHLTGEKPDLSDYTPMEVDRAENCVIKFYDWLKGKNIETQLAERALVSEKHRFGGSLDFYALIDGQPVLIDVKTGRGVYDDYLSQVAAYRLLLEEHGYPVNEVRILRIGRTEDEGFEERRLRDTSEYEFIFLRALEIYEAQRRLRARWEAA
jgi:hypothetical protein